MPVGLARVVKSDTASSDAAAPRVCRILKTDDEQQVAYGVVYEPWVLDTHGEFMAPEDVRTICHRFMQLPQDQVIDTLHDNKPNGAYPVETFIARKGDPDYPEDSWVLGVKMPDPELWARVKLGELNGFSFDALVKKVWLEAEFDVQRDIFGRTLAQRDHDHAYFVQLDGEGRVLRGWTSPGPDGHVHAISRGTVTDAADGHAHRFLV